MASLILLNDTQAQSSQSGPQTFRAGSTISDALAQAAIAAEGGLLWPATDPVVAAAALVVAKMRSKGMDEGYCSRAMMVAASASLAGGTGNKPVSGIAAGTTRTQAGATVLTGDVNRVDTSTAPAAGTTLGDGVVLPAATAGASLIVINNTANTIQVYGNGTDTINGVAAATGVSLPAGDVVYFDAGAAGAWNANTGGGVSGGLATVLAADAVSAAGTTQATGTQLTAVLNNITTVGAGTGVNLPKSAAGLEITVENNGANPLLVYPLQGATDTINGAAATVGVGIQPGSTAVFNCTAAGAWTTLPASPTAAALNVVANSDANTTLTAAQASGGTASVDVQMTGAITAGRTLIMPTVANLLAALHAPTVGTSYRIRFVNAQANAQSFTVTTNTGWTLTGGLAGAETIPQNTWREYVLTITSIGSATATLKAVANGTWS